MADDNKFCVRCGAIIPEGSSFCGECGLGINQESPNNQHFEDYIVKTNCKNLGSIPTLIILYGIVMMAFTLLVMWLVADFDNIINSLMDLAMQMAEPQRTQMLEYIEQLVNTFTESYRTMTFILGAVLLISAIAALISGIYANGYKKWKACFYLCIAATILSVATVSLITVLFVVVGAYMCYRIYQSKDLFKS